MTTTTSALSPTKPTLIRAQLRLFEEEEEGA